MANEVPVDRKLSEIFTEGYDLYQALPERTDPTNSPEFQVNINCLKTV